MAFSKLHMACFLAVGLLLVQLTWQPGLLAKEALPANAGIQIFVKETSLVESSHVRLGAVSDIHARGILKEAIEKIDLGASPKPGELKSFDRKKIVSTVQAQRYLPENIQITCPQRIYVKRLSQTILKQDVQNFVDQHLSKLFKNREYQIRTFRVRGLEPYPSGKIAYRFDSSDLVGKNGKMSFFMDIMVEGEKEGRINIAGTVAVYEDVLVARHACARGETLSREDVYLSKKNIFELNDNFIRTFDQIDQKILKSSVRKDDHLNSSLLAAPPLVQKGDIVSLIARNDNLLIVTAGISKQDGFENGLIKVENLRSGKLVRGIVRGKSKVEVVY